MVGLECPRGQRVKSPLDPRYMTTADCKDWQKRQQKGSGKKRKPKKQKGAGKKRKSKKQKGAGKQTGAGKKRTGKKRKSRKQTGDGLWSGIKEIFE